MTNRQAPTRRQWVGLIVGLMVAVLVVGGMVAIITAATKSSAIRAQQQTSARQIHASTKALHLIRSCVTPGGACYIRGAKRTADAVGSIQAAQTIAAVAATSCAAVRPHQTFEEVYRCTIRRVEAARHRR